jgi:hypothetical protein
MEQTYLKYFSVVFFLKQVFHPEVLQHTNKYCTSVNNTAFILYTTVYMSGPEIYTVVYKINFVLMTYMQYLLVFQCILTSWHGCLPVKILIRWSTFLLTSLRLQHEGAQLIYSVYSKFCFDGFHCFLYGLCLDYIFKINWFWIATLTE